MSDDQYFGTQHADLTAKRMNKFMSDNRPTIGQTWTDPATGQEVMVVPVELPKGMAAQAGLPYAWSRVLAILASLRAKEGK